MLHVVNLLSTYNGFLCRPPRLTQLYAIRGRAQQLVASGLADKVISDKQRERNEAWFEKASASFCVEQMTQPNLIPFCTYLSLELCGELRIRRTNRKPGMCGLGLLGMICRSHA